MLKISEAIKTAEEYSKLTGQLKFKKYYPLFSESVSLLLKYEWRVWFWEFILKRTETNNFR